MKYPTKEEWRGGNPFSYESAMLHLAVNNDDPEAFVHFMGDPKKCDFFMCGSLVEYAANHGAEQVLRRLWELGVEAADHLDHSGWLARCSEPPYGPRSKVMRPL